MLKKQKLSIGNSRQTSTKPAGKTALCFFFYCFFVFFPIYSERRICQAIVKLFADKLVIGKCAGFGMIFVSTFDFIRIVTFDKHVGFTYSICNRIQFLSI